MLEETDARKEEARAASTGTPLQHKPKRPTWRAGVSIAQPTSPIGPSHTQGLGLAAARPSIIPRIPTRISRGIRCRYSMQS